MITITIPLFALIILFIIMVSPSLFICVGMLIHHLNDRKGLSIVDRLSKENKDIVKIGLTTKDKENEE